MTRRARRRVSIVTIVACSGFMMAAPVFGQIRGTYSPASTLITGGTLPDPGFSFSDLFWTNTSDTLKGPKGNPLPLQTAVTVSNNTATLTYVSRRTVLGAHLEFVVALQSMADSFVLRDPLPGGSELAGGGSGLANANILPLNLGWQTARIDVQAGYSFYAPAGRFVPGAPNNTSSGFWTSAWQSGVTLYATKNKATQISLYNVYLWNTVQERTGVRPGQDDSIDYSVSQKIALTADSRWSMQVGAAGYGQWQTTENRGQIPARESMKYRVYAGGGTFTVTSPFKSLFASGSLLKEYGARNTLEGRTATLSAGFTF
jgi:hypothetical protein